MIEVKDFDTIGKPGLSREIDILFNFSFYLLKNEVGKTVYALPMWIGGMGVSQYH